MRTPGGAAAYFEANKNEIAGSKWAEIGACAERITAVDIGARTAQAVWNEQGPKGDNDASDIDKMKARIRESLKGNIPARDAALHEIAQIDADRDKAIRARDATRTSQASAMFMNGQTLAAIQRTPAWAALDGTEQRKIIMHEEASQLSGKAAPRLARVEHTGPKRAGSTGSTRSGLTQRCGSLIRMR